MDTARGTDKKIAEYIRYQLEEDQAGEQLTRGHFQTARLRAASNKPSRLADRTNAMWRAR